MWNRPFNHVYVLGSPSIQIALSSHYHNYKIITGTYFFPTVAKSIVLYFILARKTRTMYKYPTRI